MNVGCMITNGGPHPPEKWASVTAKQIIDIGASAPETLLREAYVFQSKLEDLLTGHHRLVQEHERDALDTEGPVRLAADLDTSGHVPNALEDVLASARGTSFAGHFAKPEVQAYLARLLHEHMHHIMYIERSWHADAHPGHPHSQAFKAIQTDGHVALNGTEEEIRALGGYDVLHAMMCNSVSSLPRKGED